MPQNTPMKRQFTTIDGRTVMSNLPQHWGGNDWTITGVDNPLPVGNYVQTEAGVWIPQKGSDDGAADVRLTGSKVVKLQKQNINVTSGSALEVTDGILQIDKSRIGVGIRLSASRKFRVYYVELFPETTSALSSDINIIDASTDRETAEVDVVSTHIRVFIANEDSSDLTVSRIFISNGG